MNIYRVMEQFHFRNVDGTAVLLILLLKHITDFGMYFEIYLFYYSIELTIFKI